MRQLTRRSTEKMQPFERQTTARVHASASARTRRARLFAVAALAASISALASGEAAAAPKQITFSGTIRGISPDVGRADSGDTFQTTGGTFTAIEGLKSGIYSSRFTLGSASFPLPVVRRFDVTGTFTLRTNGGTFTAVVAPATSFVSHGTIPGDALNRRFHLELEVVAGTGRFRKMTGTVEITAVATMCGWPPSLPPQPPCPDVPFGSDPIADWVTHTGTVSGTLVRRAAGSAP